MILPNKLAKTIAIMQTLQNNLRFDYDYDYLRYILLMLEWLLCVCVCVFVLCQGNVSPELLFILLRQYSLLGWLLCCCLTRFLLLGMDCRIFIFLKK